MLPGLLLAHAALLYLAWPGKTATAPAPARRLLIALLPEPARPAPRKPVEPAKPAEPSRTRTSAHVPTETPALPTAPSTAPETGSPATQAEPAPAVPSGPAPLRLGLPGRGPSTRAQSPALVQQMLSDPRSNTPRLNASERFAIALGTLDCVLDERLPDGSVQRVEGRLRKAPPRASSLDPFGHDSNTGGGFGDQGAPLGGGAIAGKAVMVCVKK